MTVDNRTPGLQVILCLASIFFADGYIKGLQLNKVKVQLTDTQPSSVIRRNILHSEAISNRPSSTLLAKLPAVPASQEQQHSFDAEEKLNNANRPLPPKKLGSRSEKSNFVVNGDETKVRRDLEILQMQDQVPRQSQGGTLVIKGAAYDQSTYLSILSQLLAEKKIRNFAAALKSLAMGEGSVNINLIELAKVLDNIVMKDLDASATSDIVWSLGKMNFVVQNYDHKNVLVALMNRFCQLKHLSPREVTTSLVGFSKLRFRWNYLSEENRKDLLIAVRQVASTLNDREVGNLLHSLSKLAVPWSALTPKLQNDLLESFIRVSKLLVSQQGSMAIYSLGLMGVTLDNVTPAVRDHIFVVSMNVLEESKVHVARSITQQVSNVIYGLAKMGVRYRSLPPNVTSVIQDGITATMTTMNEQEISNTVYSLGLMGAKWAEFPVKVQRLVKSTIVYNFNRMITQGVSNIIYGMGLMEVDWETIGSDYTDAALAAVMTSFGSDGQRRGTNGGGGNAQALANVIYSLGISGATWKDFPEKTKNVVTKALMEFGNEMTSQEVSNFIYGMGLLSADYHSLPPNAILAMEHNYDRMKLTMNEQEVCSTLHGYAKMSAKWDYLSDNMRKNMLISIASLASVGALCLACSIYSLGTLGASWDRLPTRIRELFMITAGQRMMTDQTISNVIYGLSLLKAPWAALEPEFRDVLINSLAQKDAFSADISQHIANTIWGLAKMDASWDLIPGESLETALCRANKFLTPQETANIFYGLAVMDAAWGSLSVETHCVLRDALKRTINSMTGQETANVMYSLALMVYDAPYGGPPSSIQTPEGLRNYKRSMDALWEIHRLVLNNFKFVDPTSYDRENYDQHGMYFELMRVIPGGNEVVMDIVGRLPRTTGPCGGVPSRLHANTVHAMMSNLASIRSGFDVLHEFSGLHGVFPIDSAVYYNDELVALVEIDGEFHYKQLGQLLRRKDRMKEFLYKYHYPSLPLFRIRSDQCTVIGVKRAGSELANWISSLVFAKELDKTAETKQTI